MLNHLLEEKMFLILLLIASFLARYSHFSHAQANSHECGVQNGHFHQDVTVGGRPTSEFDWPWLVAIYLLNERHGLEFRCGGTLVASDVVVTAAHCFRQHSQLIPASDIVVSLGRHNLRLWGQSDPSVTRMVKRLVVHDSFRPELTVNKDGDLAALVLESNVTFSHRVRPICLLPEDSVTIAGVVGSVPGWGFTLSSPTLPEIPQVIEADIILHEECMHSDPRFQGLLTQNTFCAKSTTAGAGPCGGDSGDGFYVAQHEPQPPPRSVWFLQGIVYRVLKRDSECDFGSNFIMLDMTVYTPWLRSVIDNKGPPKHGIWMAKPSTWTTKSAMWTATTKSPIWENCKKARALHLERLQDHSYYFSDDQPTMNWTDAQKFCRSNGMELARIENEAEWNALIPGVKRLQAKFQWVWVSGSDAEVEGQWRWTSTGDKVTFSKFDPECSKGQKTELANCMYVWSDGWCDYPCSGKTAFLCEIDSTC